MLASYLSLLSLAAGWRIGRAEDHGEAFNMTEEKETVIRISPKCASVILSQSTAYSTGGGRLSPAVLCSEGLCPTGVTSESFAAWWRSTMPLVDKGSLFSALQAIATSTGGIPTTTVAASAMAGGAIGASYLHRFCFKVDATDSHSSSGAAFSKTHSEVTDAIKARAEAQAWCASSPACKGASCARQDFEIFNLKEQIAERMEEFGLQALDFIAKDETKLLDNVSVFHESVEELGDLEKELKGRLASDPHGVCQRAEVVSRSQPYKDHLEDITALKALLREKEQQRSVGCDI